MVVSFNYAGDAVLTGLVVVSSCSLGDGDCALFLVSLHVHVTLHVPWQMHLSTWIVRTFET